MTGTLHEDLYAIMIILCRILLRMSNVSGKSVQEIKKNYVQKNFSPENRAICNIMWNMW